MRKPWVTRVLIFALWLILFRFVARRAGLAGKTDMEFVQADMVCPQFDIWTTLQSSKLYVVIKVALLDLYKI